MDAFCPFVAEKISLEEMARAYGIEVRTLHNALYDAYLTAQIFQRQIWKLEKYGATTLEKIVYLSKKGGDI